MKSSIFFLSSPHDYFLIFYLLIELFITGMASVQSCSLIFILKFIYIFFYQGYFCLSDVSFWFLLTFPRVGHSKTPARNFLGHFYNFQNDGNAFH